jgi:hypothetical protein
MTTPPAPDLRALLRRADPVADLPPLDPAAFAAGVRSRLAAPAPLARPAAPSWSERLAALPRQLFPLAAALAVLASLGAGSALAYAKHQRERTEVFADAYALSVDPWLMHTSGAHR